MASVIKKLIIKSMSTDTQVWFYFPSVNWIRKKKSSFLKVYTKLHSNRILVSTPPHIHIHFKCFAEMSATHGTSQLQAGQSAILKYMLSSHQCWVCKFDGGEHHTDVLRINNITHFKHLFFVGYNLNSRDWTCSKRHEILVHIALFTFMSLCVRWKHKPYVRNVI